MTQEQRDLRAIKLIKLGFFNLASKLKQEIIDLDFNNERTVCTNNNTDSKN